jgi:hypothetical protein
MGLGEGARDGRTGVGGLLRGTESVAASISIGDRGRAQLRRMQEVLR